MSFQVQIHEREAYRALFSFGGTIESLNPQHVSNLEAAVINARAFAGEVVAMLRGSATEELQTAEVA
jgi:chromosome partitioning protein